MVAPLVTAVPPDYDTDPGRWRSGRRDWLLAGDIHEVVAERLRAERRAPVLDVGCGQGRLAELLPADAGWVGVDASQTQLHDCAFRPVVLADAAALPFRDAAFGAVTALWMLYHLDDPSAAIAEARRVLQAAGLFVASTSSRSNNAELVDEVAPTTFDAEDAPDIVAAVFGNVEVDAWDGQYVYLADEAAVRDFVRSQLLPPESAERVTPPVSITKRGCVVYASRPAGDEPG